MENFSARNAIKDLFLAAVKNISQKDFNYASNKHNVSRKK
jgi:hypothetical protein